MSHTQTSIDRLVEVIALLREHCPWMAALTHESLVTYLLEESYELAEAIESGGSADLRGELGDVLLQVVLHSRLAEEEGRFALSEVAQGISDKMVRRNPHVFRPDGSLQETGPAAGEPAGGGPISAGSISSGPISTEQIEDTWHRVKKLERSGGAGSVFTGIPAAMPALSRAQKTLDRAARGGLPVPTTALFPAAAPQTEGELGDLLLALVGSARLNGLDAERALRGAVRRFQHGADQR